MKNTKILFAFVLLTLSFVSYSQNGFIEIEVRDSVKLKPISIDYILSVEENYEEEAVSALEEVSEDSKSDELKAKAQEKIKLNNLETFLKKNKYKYISLTDSSFETGNKSRVYFEGGYSVTVSSVEELKKLTTEIKKMQDIAGYVGTVKYEEPNIYEDQLLKSLLEKAKIKAQKIATLANINLGKIIEIREVKEVDNSSYNFFQQIMKLSGKNKHNLVNSFTNNYVKALVIKFKAE
ncbi:MAG TPA: SIMPL domain-containing protein [Flavobacterium sp.]|uniref:SIMPL domain-containing protein n=1 Tax=Flavobacterium sp. TaxID=239 RepID=UPI002BC3C1CC|nr:SIMPL domain-containing protein [Flavobacterium sp.]HSD13585.1 SIMPL domain-containing protein [Flavobacterium sp.]